MLCFCLNVIKRSYLRIDIWILKLEGHSRGMKGHGTVPFEKWTRKNGECLTRRIKSRGLVCVLGAEDNSVCHIG